ncbi:4'-phosphopantetheinyl transferase [Rhodococcus sp. NPDC059234]|uniref:4'-phosphopantetheinyl transferase family protein n=1 Tax=Rhodococcus sp. NPDC059234 TaxID=3346781 RepID=UPI00366B90D6
MIESILPDGVAYAELFEDPPGLTALPQEEALIARAVDKRRREFISVRHCAREAMAKLGVDAAPILKGDRGVPLFPRGVVGSLTHCDGYRGAVLGYSMQVRSVGIDAEPHGPLPDGVLDAVSLPEERIELAAKADDRVHWDRLLFCAKEATYKAWFPLTGRWLGFEDARITLTLSEAGDGPGAEPAERPRRQLTGAFRSELLVPGQTTDGPPLSSFDGRWLVADGLVIAAITVQ